MMKETIKANRISAIFPFNYILLYCHHRQWFNERPPGAVVSSATLSGPAPIICIREVDGNTLIHISCDKLP